MLVVLGKLIRLTFNSAKNSSNEVGHIGVFSLHPSSMWIFMCLLLCTVVTLFSAVVCIRGNLFSKVLPWVGKSVKGGCDFSQGKAKAA